MSEAIEAPLVELWVDGSAPAGGSGRSDQPYRDLKSALVPQAVIHLAPGIYPGPITLPEGAALLSRDGLGVIALEGPGTVVTATRGRLEGISIQGGEVGLWVRGRLSSKQLRLSGQRKLGAQVESAGEWLGEKTEIVAVIPDVDGVRALAGAKLTLRGAKLSGSMRRGIDASDAEVALVDVASLGVKEQLHQEGGRATLSRCSAAAGSGPAFFVAGASLDAEGLETQGHEYAVLSGNRAVVNLSQVTARAPLLAALGLVLSKVRVKNARLEGGSYAAVQLLESESTLSDVHVVRAREAGVVVRLGRAELTRVTVQDVALDGDSGGDGFHLRGGDVTLRQVLVQGAAGSAVLATAAAKVHIFGLGSERCRNGALMVELDSVVDARGVVVKDSGGPALVVPDESVLDVSDLVLAGDQLPVWAECEAGARVTLKGIRGAEPWRAPPCVEVKRQ